MSTTNDHTLPSNNGNSLADNLKRPVRESKALAQCKVLVAHSKYVRGADRFERRKSDELLLPIHDFESGNGYAVVKPEDMLRTTRLFEALTQTYSTDAHAVAYYFPGSSWFARVNKSALASLDGMSIRPQFMAAFVDVDNEDHEPLPLGRQIVQLKEFLERVRDAGLPRPGAYITRAGLRAVWPLALPWSITLSNVDELEARLRGLRMRLVGAGITGVDEACADWTRFNRLTRVVRDEVFQDLPTSFEDVEALDLATIDPVQKPVKAHAMAASPLAVPVTTEAENFCIRQVRYELRRLGPAISGHGGHNRTFVAANICVRYGLSAEAAWAQLLEYNATCLPPWTESELRHKLDDARKANGGTATGAGA